MSELSHREAERIAAELEMGLVDDADRLRLELHLERCAVCAERESRLRRARSALRDEEVGRVDASALASAQLAARRVSHAPSTPPRRVMPTLAIAAAALLVASAVVAVVVARRPAAWAGDRPCPGVVAARTGGAVLRVRTSQASRCELSVDRGEVHLHVDPAAETRVEIAAGDLVARVLGTVLSIAVDEEGRGAVTVERGRVAVARRGAEVIVAAGETAREQGAGLSAAAPADRSALESLRVSFALRDGLAAREALDTEGGPTARGPETRAVEQDAIEHRSPPAPETLAQRVLDEHAPDEAPLDQAPFHDPAASTPAASTHGSLVEVGVAAEHSGATAAPRRRAAAAPEPSEPRVEVSALRRLVAAGRTAEARAQVSREEARASSSTERAELWTVVAESYAADGAHARSLEAYLRAAESGRSPTARLALLSAADVALDRLNEPGRALGLYDTYLRVAPRTALAAAASLGRCRALHELGRVEEARRCAEALIAAGAEGPVRRGAERLLR